jgi:hypothetical protein
LTQFHGHVIDVIDDDDDDDDDCDSVNVTFGPKEDRLLTTGLHTVCDTFCLDCGEAIGWFYVRPLYDLPSVMPYDAM